MGTRSPSVGLEAEAAVPPIPQHPQTAQGTFRRAHNKIIKLAMKITNISSAQGMPKEPSNLPTRLYYVYVHSSQLNVSTTILVHGLSSQLIRHNLNLAAEDLTRNKPWMKSAPWDGADRYLAPFLTWKIMLLISTESTIHRILTTGHLPSSMHA